MTAIPSASEPIPAELYKQFCRMLHSFVWRYQGLPAVTREDLLGEAHLIFCQAVRSYDPAFGASFGTYLYSRLESITHYIRKQVVQSNATDTSGLVDEDGEALQLLDFVGKADPAFAQMEWSEYYRILSPDAREIMDWHQYGDLEAPPESKTKKGKPLTAWSVFQRKAGPVNKKSPDKAGWTWDRTKAAYSELENVLREYAMADDNLVEAYNVI